MQRLLEYLDAFGVVTVRNCHRNINLERADQGINIGRARRYDGSSNRSDASSVSCVRDRAFCDATNIPLFQDGSEQKNDTIVKLLKMVSFQVLKMALILLLLIGAVFGFGFKVRVLIPATFLTVILTSSSEIMHERGSLITALVTTAAVIAIQTGYLIGVVVRVGTDSGLTAVRGSEEQQQRSLKSWFRSLIHP
jgi:hypothetical protein